MTPHANSFLRHLQPDELDALTDQCRLRCYDKNEHVFHVNDADNNLYIIESGMVRATLFSMQGKEVSFIDMRAGENFGEFSAIDGEPRSANVIALKPSSILIMPPEIFLRLVTENSAVCMEVMGQLTAVVRRLCDRIFEYSTLDVTRRIHLEILRLAKQNIDLDGVARISKPPTQAELASRLTCNREAVSREYSYLEQMGIMQKQRGKLIFDNLQKLETLVADAAG